MARRRQTPIKIEQFKFTPGEHGMIQRIVFLHPLVCLPDEKVIINYDDCQALPQEGSIQEEVHIILNPPPMQPDDTAEFKGVEIAAG